MQSWLKWYSIGLENRHSERISEFESQALRKHYFNNDLWCNGSMTVSKTVGSGSNPDESAMHEWRDLEDAPDLESDAEMHVSSNLTSCTCSMYLERNKDERFRD